MKPTLLGIVLGSTVLIGSISACSSAPAPVEEAVKAPVSRPREPERLYYTLRSGEPVVSETNLPVRTDVYVDWHYDDGATKTYTGFRGWDFVGDGHFGMLEVLDENGLPQHYIFDFLGDGHPQWQVEVEGLK